MFKKINFQEDLERGKTGEEFVKDLLLTRFNGENKKVVRIDDVRCVTDFQQKDIDFILHMDVENKRKFIAVEVKTDEKASKTGNLFIETKTQYTKDGYDKEGNLIYKKGQIRQGWFFASQADWFFWYVEGHKKVYACTAKQLKNYVKNYHPRTAKCNDGYKINDGYLVSIEHFCEKCNVKIFDIE